MGVKATWNWSKEPLILYLDIIACTTSESGFTKVSSSGSAYYRTKKGAIKATYTLKTETKNSGTGVYADIDLAKTYSGGARPTKMIAYEGYILASFKATSKKISSVGISSNYGHTTIAVSPSVSFDKQGGISFSPSLYVSSGPEAYKRLEL